MDGQQSEHMLKAGEVPFFPNHFLKEVVVAFAVLGFVFILAGVGHKELGPPANTIMTPTHIAPEWYFLWLFGLLKIVPELLGLLITGILALVVLLLPWLDRSKTRELRARRKILISTAVTLGLMAVLTVIGLRL